MPFRSVCRSLTRAPFFSAIAVATLAIGISTSTAMFSVVEAVLLRPLPFHEPDRLVELFESNAAEGRENAGVSPANFADWRARSRTFDGLALLMIEGTPYVVGGGDMSVQARASLVTPNLLSVLRVQPAVGRGFSDGAPRDMLGESEILLSHTFWHRAFGGDAAVVGKRIRVEGAAPSVVVGVMPPEFRYPQGVDIWMPIDLSDFRQRDARFAHVIGRLKAATTLEGAQADMESVAAALSTEHPEANRGWSIRLSTLRDSSVSTYRLSLITLFAATVFVVLVGCANLSNLQLARGAARHAELAVRTALGASRCRLMRLLLVEALALAAAGGLTSLVLLQALMPLLIQLGSRTVPQMADAGINGRVLLFCVAMSTLAAILSVLLPAIRLSRVDLQAAMKPGGERSTWHAGHRRVQHVVVAGQLAVCLVLVVGAMLFIRTFVALSTTQLGFTPEHVISIDARFPMFRTMERNRWQLLARDTTAALDRLRAVPGVEAVSAVNHAPLSGTVVPVKVTLAGETQMRRAFYRNVTPDYFRTLGVPVLAGRDFTTADISDLARLPDPRSSIEHRREGVVIVNETAAKDFWPGENPIGKLLSTEYDPGISGRRVVGVIRDLRSGAIREAAPTEVYVPYLEDPSFSMTLLVRTRLPINRIVPAMRHEIHQVAPDLSTANVRPLDDIVVESMGSAPFNTVVVSVFAVTSLVLSAIGVFAVFAFAVATRTREIGIRSALGATRRDVARLFLREAATPITLGIVVGSLTAIALARLVTSLLFGVAPVDPVSFVVAIGVLAAVAFAASYLPVRHAHKQNPATTLRSI